MSVDSKKGYNINLNKFLKSSEFSITDKYNAYLLKVKFHLEKHKKRYKKQIKRNINMETAFWKNDYELFDIVRNEIYTAVTGDIMDDLKY